MSLYSRERADARPVLLPTRHRLQALCAAALTTVLLGTAHAQAPNADAANPQQAAALPSWSNAVLTPASAPELPTQVDEAIRRWQAANRAVAEFPRGHIDLLRWEQQRASTAPAAAAPTPLNWPEVWQAVQRQHSHLWLSPRANTNERLQAQRQWLTLQRQAQQAWVQACTQQALLRLQHEREHAARTAYALGERMATLGHWSRARLIPLQQSLAQEHAGTIAAQWQARQATEALASLMSLWQADAVQALAQRLPLALDVPAAVVPPANAEGEAIRQRPELQWQRETTERTLRSVGTAQWETWTQERDAALQTSPAQAPPQWPPSALRGDHALDKALDAQAELQREGAALRRQVRLAWDRLQATQALDQLQQQHTVPLAQAAEAETLLRYNGMLQSTWEVIDAARTRLGAQAAAITARQDHWLAYIDWQTLMAGGDVALPTELATGSNNAAGGAAQGH